MEVTHHQTLHDMPNELLTKVFKSITVLSLREWSESYAGSGNSWGLPFPMLACSVCRHWRSVALSSPELWSTIYVPFFASGRVLLADPVKFTSLWLTRSKAASLEVFLSVPPLSLAFDLAGEVILPKVMQHLDRLRSLSIVANSGHVLTFPNVKGMLSPLVAVEQRSPLHTLSLRFQGGASTSTRITERTALLDRDWNAPDGEIMALNALETLELEGVRVKAAFFPHLVSLTVYDLVCTVEEFKQLFESLPALRQLALFRLQVFDEVATMTNFHPLIASNLQILSLSFTRRPLDSTLPYPATILRLPNLSRLDLDGSSSVPICSCLDSSFISALDNLQTLRVSNYSRFALDSHSESTWSDINLLQRIISIRHLELINSPVGQLLKTQPQAPSLPQRSRLGWQPRATLSPQLAETSHTLEATFQRMRINAIQGRVTPQSAEEPVRGPITQTSSTTATVKTVAWSNLDGISIDSLNADDVVALCRYVGENPHIRSVRLSGPAQRHLSRSVKRRISDGVFDAPSSFITGTRKTMKGEPNTAEVESGEGWLRQRVTILPFRHEL
ncbi:hypothetical protein BKA70DRAFT_1412901 [Coprinopsis sp. MPI-PUGE-AT-0042]|nr:hypothetical protein BKA70DRAFT_1412901 [Coprinopsis sp. MPI-PUGE-AT-0042]